MRSGKMLLVLVVVTALVVAAAVVSQRSTEQPVLSHGPHVPDLGPRVDAVGSVEIQTSESSLDLALTDAGWVARSRDDYPANAERIRQLVFGISNLRRLDRKTSNPERLPRLELSDIDQTGSRAVQIRLLTDGGEELAGILVGKTQDFQQEGRSRYFVRDIGDPQSWLVEGSLPPVLEDFPSWLDRKLMPGVAEAGLRSVAVTHPGGAIVEVERVSREDENFRLAGLTEDEELDSQYRVNTVAETLGRLSLKDVRAADDAALAEPVATIEGLTFNGVRIVARIGRSDPDYRVRLEAAYEPDHDSAGDESEAGGEALARALNGRWRGKSFVVARHTADSLLVERGDLLKAPENTEAE
jgi:hypothetical protein